MIHDLSNAVIPNTISQEARVALAEPSVNLNTAEMTLEQQRELSTVAQNTTATQQRSKYDVVIEDDKIAGVPVRLIRPRVFPEHNRHKVLLNLHGGAFCLDSGSLTENIPIASLTQTLVIAGLYRLAPEYPFPAAVDDAEAIYEALLERYIPEHIGIYGTSAGAILGAQTLVRLKQEGKPLPAALGFFSGTADLEHPGDTEYLFQPADDFQTVRDLIAGYIAGHDVTDYALSPIKADLTGFPPTLCISATRDFCLSQTTLFHRALLRAGVTAHLVVFEAMPHAHWSYLDVPEATDAFDIMADFFIEKLA